MLKNNKNNSHLYQIHNDNKLFATINETTLFSFLELAFCTYLKPGVLKENTIKQPSYTKIITLMMMMMLEKWL